MAKHGKEDAKPCERLHYKFFFFPKDFVLGSNTPFQSIAQQRNTLLIKRFSPMPAPQQANLALQFNYDGTTTSAYEVAIASPY